MEAIYRTATSEGDDPRIWGPPLWKELFDWIEARPERSNKATVQLWLDEFAERIPCKECREHWLEICEEYPPPVTRPALRRWAQAQRERVKADVEAARQVISVGPRRPCCGQV